MFERYVTGTKPSWRRRAVLFGSLGAHGAAAAALLVASVFYVAEIGPPPLAIMFAPTPAPKGDSTKPKELGVKPQHKKKLAGALTQPQPRSVAPEAPPAVAPTEPVEPGEPGGGEEPGAGTPNGTTGGMGPIGPPAPAVASQVRPRNIGPHALDTERISGAEPHLPDFVRAQRVRQGETPFVAKVCVDQSGQVSRVDVLQGIPGADESIVRTLRGWRYKAQPIPVCFVSRLIFSVTE